MSIEILEKKVQLVRDKRIEFIRKNFPLRDTSLLIKNDYGYNLEQTLIIPSWIDIYLLKKLKIKSKKKQPFYIQFRASYTKKGMFEKATTKIDGLRKNIYNIDYDRWLLLEKYLRQFINDKDILREMKRERKEAEVKKELCRLTSCYSRELATLLCDCGWVNPAEAQFCAECGISLV